MVNDSLSRYALDKGASLNVVYNMSNSYV